MISSLRSTVAHGLPIAATVDRYSVCRGAGRPSTTRATAPSNKGRSNVRPKSNTCFPSTLAAIGISQDHLELMGLTKLPRKIRFRQHAFAIQGFDQSQFSALDQHQGIVAAQPLRPGGQARGPLPCAA